MRITGLGSLKSVSSLNKISNQQWCIRLILRHYGYAPFQYTRFLDYAAERIFLRKVGGGYIFVHRMLLEYFASLGEAEKNQEKAVGAEE
jgi:hypothetical protein